MNKFWVKRLLTRLGIIENVRLLLSCLRQVEQNLFGKESLAKTFRKMIPTEALCFDIGVNVGQISDVLVKLGYRLVVVEPHPKLFKILKKKYQKNKNVFLVNKAISDFCGRKIFHICLEDSALSTLSEEWVKNSRFARDHYRWENKIEVECETLDSLISLFGLPYFCKVDVEGHEKSVFTGLTQPIPILMFEANIELLQSTVETVELLSKKGYRSYNLITPRGQLVFNRHRSSAELMEHLRKHSNLVHDILAFHDTCDHTTLKTLISA